MAAATTTALAIGALAIAAAGTAVSVQQGQAAAKDAKDAAKKEQRLNELASARKRRQEVRKGRVARGQALNAGAQVGARGGSGLAGGLSGIGSDVGDNLGFSTQTEALGNKISKANQRAADHQSNASLAGAVAGLAGSAFSAAGGFDAAFAGSTNPPAAPMFSPTPTPAPRG